MMNGFTDGSPLFEFCAFAFVFAFFLIASRFAPVSRIISWFVHLTSQFARARGAFVEVELLFDLRKIDLVRIGAGALAFGRNGSIFMSAVANGDRRSASFAAVATGLSFLVSIGFVTPVATLVLMVSANLLIDNALGASTLGSMVLSMVLLMLFLAPAGRTLSVDAWLAARPRPSRLIQFLHILGGDVGTDRLLFAKLAALAAYYCLCLYSVLLHLRDEAWTSGQVIVWLLLSNLANPHFSGSVQSLFGAHPLLFILSARTAAFGMFAWYFLVLPGLFLGRIVRNFSIFWGLCFFIISTFVLPLSYLGYYELLLWFALFATGPALGSRSSTSMAILFDDRCNLCDRTVRTLSSIDIFRRLEFRPIRLNPSFLAEHGISLERGLVDLIGVDPVSGNQFAGFRLYTQIALRVFLLWPVLPIFLVGIVTRLGPPVYRFVAARRTRLFGICEASTIPARYVRPSAPLFLAAKSPSSMNVSQYPSIPTALIATLVVLLAAFVVRLPVTPHSDLFRFSRWSKTVFGSAPLAFGIGKINVFNSIDLSAIRYAYTVYDPDAAGPLSDDARSSGNPAVVLRMNDAELYWIEAQLRRTSRQNIRCDEAFFARTANQFAAAARESQNLHGHEVLIEISTDSLPSVSQLQAYKPVQYRRTPICRVIVNIDTGQYSSPVYIQSGVDQVMRDSGYEPILSAQEMRSALTFPSRQAAAFINANVDATTILLSDADLVHSARGLCGDEYGRFEIDCIADVYRFTSRRPNTIDPTYVNAAKANCRAGVQLVSAFARIPTLPLDVNSRIREAYRHAVRAQWRGDWPSCIKATYKASSAYWATITKSSVL
jgi:predicted DCC family thiol-disulfide oxidoreductase YuxK